MEVLNSLYLTHFIKRKIKNYNFRGKSYLIKIINYFSPAIKDNIIVKTKYGYKLKIHPLFDKGIERAIFDKGVYEDGTLWCFSKIIRKGFIVADIGANIGLTAVHASRLVGDSGVVYAFEPLKSTFKILNENININKLKNVVTNNVALSNFEGKTMIYQNLHINRGAASIYSSVDDCKGIEIDVTTFNKFCFDFGLLKFDFIKIDIEGSEFPMLKGGKDVFLSNDKPIVCIEYSKDVESKYNTESIYEFLKDTCKYRVFKQLKGKETQTPLIEVRDKFSLPLHDNLYCFSNFHLELLPADLFFDSI
jgi:FkbM family methyltransferase